MCLSISLPAMPNVGADFPKTLRTEDHMVVAVNSSDTGSRRRRRRRPTDNYPFTITPCRGGEVAPGGCCRREDIAGGTRRLAPGVHVVHYNYLITVNVILNSGLPLSCSKYGLYCSSSYPYLNSYLVFPRPRGAAAAACRRRGARSASAAASSTASCLS